MNPLDLRRLGLALLVAPVLGLPGCRCCRPCVAPCTTTVAAPMEYPGVAATTASAPQPGQVLLQIRMYEVDDDAAARLHVGEAGAGRAYGVVPSKAGEELVATLANETGVHVVSLPAILTLFGQEATVFVGETIGPDVPGRTGVPPLTFAGGDNWTGLRVAAIVAPPSADGTLSIDFTVAWRRPPDGATLPDLATLRVAAAAVPTVKLGLRSGETAVLGSPTVSGPKAGKLLVLVKATLVSGTASP